MLSNKTPGAHNQPQANPRPGVHRPPYEYARPWLPGAALNPLSTKAAASPWLQEAQLFVAGLCGAKRLQAGAS